MFKKDVKIIEKYGTRQIFSVTLGERKTVNGTFTVIISRNLRLFIKNTGLCVIK